MGLLPLTYKLRIAHVPGMPVIFCRHRGLPIPTYITEHRNVRDASAVMHAGIAN